MENNVSISVGVPVFNGAATIEQVLEGLRAQTFRDFEIIISDNCSTDETGDICERFTRSDDRVTYFRQPENIGPAKNFEFLLSKARGRYFLFAAADDFRSPDFLEINFSFLEGNATFVASTCPDRLVGGSEEDNETFALTGDAPDRFLKFFQNCWKSHGLFYSLARTSALKSCDVFKTTFWASDWAIVLFLATIGELHRTSTGLTEFGRTGVSNTHEPYRHFRSSSIDIFFPYFQMSRYVLKISRPFPRRVRRSLAVQLVLINITTTYQRVVAGINRNCTNFVKRMLVGH